MLPKKTKTTARNGELNMQDFLKKLWYGSDWEPQKEETPAEEPTGEAPAEETPAEEPAPETPAEETPAEEPAPETPAEVHSNCQPQFCNSCLISIHVILSDTASKNNRKSHLQNDVLAFKVKKSSFYYYI